MSQEPPLKKQKTEYVIIKNISCLKNKIRDDGLWQEKPRDTIDEKTLLCEGNCDQFCFVFVTGASFCSYCYNLDLHSDRQVIWSHICSSYNNTDVQVPNGIIETIDIISDSSENDNDESENDNDASDEDDKDISGEDESENDNDEDDSSEESYVDDSASDEDMNKGRDSSYTDDSSSDEDNNEEASDRDSNDEESDEE